MARRPARQAHRGRPQRVIGRRHEYFVTGIEQSIHGHHDQLRDPVADIDVLQRHALDVLLLRVMHDGLARREDPFRVRITRRIRQVADHVELDFFGRLEAESGEVADVELDDVVALVLHLLRLLQHGAADVIADVVELV